MTVGSGARSPAAFLWLPTRCLGLQNEVDGAPSLVELPVITR
jgi:hypothetical protein